MRCGNQDKRKEWLKGVLKHKERRKDESGSKDNEEENRMTLKRWKKSHQCRVKRGSRKKATLYQNKSGSQYTLRKSEAPQYTS